MPTITPENRREHFSALVRFFALYATDKRRVEALTNLRDGAEDASDLALLRKSLEREIAYTSNGGRRALAKALCNTLAYYEAAAEATT